MTRGADIFQAALTAIFSTFLNFIANIDFKMTTQSHLVSIKEGHLCPRCQNILSLTPSTDDGSLQMNAFYDTNSTIQELNLMIQDGCYIYNELLRGLGTLITGNLDRIQIQYTMVTDCMLADGWSKYAYLNAFVLVEGIRKPSADFSLSFKKIEEEGMPDSVSAMLLLLLTTLSVVPLSVPVLGASTGSEETFDFVRQKLSDFDAHHSLCAESRHAHYPFCTTSGVASEWYPSRLIDVGPSELHDCSPRLIVTSQTPINGPYTTLSHCWGEVKHCHLPRVRLISFCKGSTPHKFQRRCYMHSG